MNDEQLRQRIAYLVEHGGICDDPLHDIRRHIRLLYWLGAVGALALALDLGLHFFR
jgi:hypothetical protein